MKITKRQILKIIREEAEGFNVARAFGAIQDRRDEEEAVMDPEVETDAVIDAWAGGDNLVEPIDQAEASGAEAATTEQEIEEIVERISRKARIKRIIREVDWVDPMAHLEDSEAVERAFASGNRISLMIDQPGIVGEVEPSADDEEVVELEERVARAFHDVLKEEEQKPPEEEGEEQAAEGEEPPAEDEGEDSSEDPKTQAGKKAAVALDKSAAEPLVSAIDAAGNLAGVEEILTQLIQQMSDDGKGLAKKAMQNLVREA